MTVKMTDTALLFGLEATEGVDPTLTGANYLEPIEGSITFNPSVSDRTEHRVYDGTFGSRASSTGTKRSSLNFQVALRGSGTPGDVIPVIGELIQASGYIETINAGTDVTYTQDSDFTNTGAFYYFAGSQKHVILGARCQMNIVGSIGGFLLAELSVLGLQGPHTDEAPPANTTTYPNGPFTVREENSVWTIHGFEVAGRNFNLNAQSPSEFFETTRDKEIIPQNFTPQSTITYKVEDFATFDPIAIGDADTEAAASFQWGPGAGEIFTLNAPFTQFSVDSHTDEQNVVLYNTTNMHNKSVGDDAISLVLT